MLYGLLLGYISLVIAQVMIGVNVIIGKIMLDVMPIYLFLWLRFFVSAVGLTAGFVLTRCMWLSPYHPSGKVEGKDWGMMILQGLFGGFLFNFFFLWGLEYTTATSAGIIGSSLPVIISLSAFFILKERISVAMGFAILFAALGILVISLDNLTVTTGQRGSYLGDFLILVAMFPEAWYSIVGKFLANRIRPLAAAVVANWVTVLLFTPWCLMEFTRYDWSVLSAFHWGLITLGGMGSLLFFWLWPWGLKYVSATKASLFGGLMPVSTCALAIICLGESFHTVEAVGTLMVFLSLWMGSKHGEQLIEKKVLARVRSRE